MLFHNSFSFIVINHKVYIWVLTCPHFYHICLSDGIQKIPTLALQIESCCGSKGSSTSENLSRHPKFLFQPVIIFLYIVFLYETNFFKNEKSKAAKSVIISFKDHIN